MKTGSRQRRFLSVLVSAALLASQTLPCFPAGASNLPTYEQTAASASQELSTLFTKALLEVAEPATPQVLAVTGDTADGFAYSVTDDAVTITGYTGEASVLAIPSEIDGLPVTIIGEYAFKSNETLTSVSIPSSVVTIGYGAFSYAKNITEIHLSEGLKLIVRYAFSETGITSITIPASVEESHTDIFYGTSLSEITFAEGTLKVPSNICYDVKTLETVNIPDSVTEIGSCAFQSCTALTEITLPDSLIKIEDSAFSGSGLTSLTLPKNVEVLAQGCFSKTAALQTVVIPKAVTDESYSSFEGSGLTSIAFEAGLTVIPKNICYDCKSLTKVTIPDSVTEIAEDAFVNCTALADITFPDSIVAIKETAFANTGLTKAELPKKLVSLDGSAFGFCENLTSAWIPATLTESGTNSMWVSYSGGPFTGSPLTSVEFEEGVTIIPVALFYECTSLTEIAIPSTLTEIAKYAFWGCEGIDRFNLSEGLETIGEKAFAACPKLTEITIPSTVTKAGADIFIDTGLQTITFAGGMTTIPESMCVNAKTLTTVTFPESLTKIEAYAFENCESLTEITFPESVTLIGYRAFSKTSLTSLTLPKTVETLDGYCFANIVPLKAVFVPKTVDSKTSDSAFHSSGLESIEFEAGTETIMQGVCEDCLQLTDVKLYDGVKRIEHVAFAGCTALETMILPDTVEAVSTGAFYGCAALKNLHLSTSLTTVGESTFAYCTSLKELTVPAGIAHYENSSIYYEAVFAGCGIEKLTFVDDTTHIGGYYREMPFLKEIVMPDTVTEIDGRAFASSLSLEQVTLPPNLVSLGNDAFGNCPSLTEIYLPATLTKAGSAFAKSGVEVVTFGDGMTTIPDNIMYQCSFLLTAVIPKSVTAVGRYAFAECTNLRKLEMTQQSLEFASSSFSECDKLKDNRVSIYTIEDTSLLTNVQSAKKGGLTNYTVYYRVNDRFWNESEPVDIYVRFDNAEIVPESITVNDAEIESYYYSIPVTAQEGIIRFSLRAASDKALSADVCLRVYHNYAHYSQRIGTQETATPPLSLCVPRFVSERTLTVSGMTDFSTEVKFFVDGVEQGSCVTSSRTGRYTYELTLPEKETNVYEIIAKTDSCSSAPSQVSFFADAPFVRKVMMQVRGHIIDRRDITAVFTQDASPTMMINPNHPVQFEVTVGNQENVERIYVTSETNGELSCLEAFYDETKDAWVASGKFATRVPGALNISILEKGEEIALTAVTNEDGTVGIDKNYSDDAELAQILPKMTGNVLFEDENNIASGYTYTDDMGTISYGVYNGISDTAVLDGKTVTVEEIEQNPTAYGFLALPVTQVDENGVQHTYFIKAMSDSADVLSMMNAAQSSPVAPAPGRYNLPTASDFVKGFTGLYGDVISGTLVFDYVQNKTLGGSSKFVSTFFSTGAIEFLQRNVEVVLPSGEVFKGGVDGVMSGINAALSTVDFASDLYDIYDADSSNKEVNDHAAALTLFATSIAVARVSTGLIAVGAAATVVAGTLAIGPIVATAAVVATVALINYGLSTLHGYLRDIIKGKARFSCKGFVRYLIDPSGYVYEWISSNRLSGVTATIYYKDSESGEAVIWDAENFDQQNPLITDSAGWYAWDVPEGLWQVRFEKDGYETMSSEWLPVCPVQTDINLAMTSTTAPAIERVDAYPDAVTVHFTKHMQEASITEQSLSLSADGKLIPCRIHFVKESDNNTACSNQAVLTPMDGSFSDYTGLTLILTADAKSYAEVAAEPSEMALTLLNRLNSFSADATALTMNVGDSATVALSALPASAAAGLEISISGAEEFLDIPETIALGADGTAELSFAARQTGMCMITLSAQGGAWTRTISVVVGIHMEVSRQGEEQGEEFLFGDIDNNDVVNASDATLVLQYYVSSLTGKEEVLTPAQFTAYDMTGDGVINATDANCILMYYVQSIAGVPTSWREITGNPNAPA